MHLNQHLSSTVVLVASKCRDGVKTLRCEDITFRNATGSLFIIQKTLNILNLHFHIKAVKGSEAVTLLKGRDDSWWSEVGDGGVQDAVLVLGVGGLGKVSLQRTREPLLSILVIIINISLIFDILIVQKEKFCLFYTIFYSCCTSKSWHLNKTPARITGKIIYRLWRLGKVFRLL